tara:strand:+ start:458 stop:664 length:207 start_codon:yes stop_codon:yes gene_type:complete
MQFVDIDAFLNMGGHGLYVWLSYGVGLVVFIIAFISPILKKKRIIKELSQLQRRQTRQKMKQNTEGIN